MTKSFSRGVDPLRLDVHITFDNDDFERVFANASDPIVNALYGRLMGPGFGDLDEAGMSEALRDFAERNAKIQAAEAKANAT